MALPLVVMIALAVFGGQLALCFSSLKKEWKWVPLAAAVVLEMLFWCVFVLGNPSLVLYVLIRVLVLCIGAMLLAWGLYYLVKAVQKRHK